MSGDWDVDIDDYFNGDSSERSRPFSSRHPLGDPTLAAEFLRQGDTWCSNTGYTRIADMEPSHALAAARFVLDRATSVALVVYAADPDATNRDSVAYGDVARRALLDTPLLKALVERGGDDQASVLPWLAAAKVR